MKLSRSIVILVARLFSILFQSQSYKIVITTKTSRQIRTVAYLFLFSSSNDIRNAPFCPSLPWPREIYINIYSYCKYARNSRDEPTKSALLRSAPVPKSHGRV